jgi:uncharacterized protein (DUF2147 family)
LLKLTPIIIVIIMEHVGAMVAVIISVMEKVEEGVEDVVAKGGEVILLMPVAGSLQMTGTVCQPKSGKRFAVQGNPMLTNEK